MTRTEFILNYAQRSNSPDQGAACIGLFDLGDRGSRRIALPCACGADNCKGWAMVGIEQVLHHLQFDAPDKLQDAYMEAVDSCGGE